MYVLQSNSRFTVNWIPMFVVTLSQRITNTCHITHNMHRRRSCQHPPPHPLRPKYSPFRHLMIFSRRVVSDSVMACSVDNGYRRFEKIYILYIYPVYSAIKCLMMEATASHTYQTTQSQFQITPFIYTVSLQLGPPVDHTNPRKLTVAHLVLPVHHRHSTGHTTFPCPLMKLSTDNLFAIKKKGGGVNRVCGLCIDAGCWKGSGVPNGVVMLHQQQHQ
jgi:hypothetical protein